MKKRLLSLVLGMIVMLSAFPIAANAADGIPINSENFPDDVFRNYVSSFIDADNDQVLSEKEISYVKKIFLNSFSVTDLKGIEFFTSLESLTCEDKNLQRLDVSANEKLKELNCRNNKITSLKLNNPVLKSLDCLDNLLTELDISGSSELTDLNCYQNLLTKLDVSGSKKLSDLNCGYNQLTSIDLSQNPNLIELDVSHNKLSNLDLTNNQLLKNLYCDSNYLSDLNLENNRNLTDLNCGFNQLKALDVRQNTLLEGLAIPHNQISELDLTKNTRLFYLNVRFNCLAKVDFNADYSPGEHSDSQYVSKDVRKTADGWLLDISELVGTENLSKVTFIPHEEKDWSYDESTGIACYAGNKLPATVMYCYGKTMAVTVKLRSPEDFVVMKEGAEQAVVNGVLAPTTKYASGYAKMVNINGSMQMPLRYIAEVNNFNVQYDESTGQINVHGDTVLEWLTITPGSAWVEKYVWLNQAPDISQAPFPFTVQDGVTMGPLRFTCEAMGLSVYYQETEHGNYVVISPVAKTPEEALEKIEEAYQLGL